MNAQVQPQSAERKASPVELYRQQVLPPEKADDLWRSLPAHIKPAVFERNLMNALMQNPDLMRFHPSLVFREVSKSAGLGLLLDPQLGEAYMVVAYNYKTKQQEPQLRVGYKGVIKLARQAGNVESIYAHEVHEKDHIVCQQGTDKKLIHEPKLFTDRGRLIGFYAVIKYKDGAFDFEPMSVEQCQAIRDRSDAWKAYKEGKIKSTPWLTDEPEMSKKTCLRRLLKRQDQSPELRRAIEIEDEAEFPEMRNVTPPRAGADDGPPMPPPAQIAHQQTVPMEKDNVVDLVAVKATEEQQGEVVWADEPSEESTTETFDKMTPAEEKQWLTDLDGALGGCEDTTCLAEQQTKLMMPMRGKVSNSAWKGAEGHIRRHFERIAKAAEPENILAAG